MYKWSICKFGKKQVFADTLSRARLNEAPPEEEEIQVNTLERIVISEPKYADLQRNTSNDLERYAMIQARWPETKQQVPNSICHYWDTRNKFAVLDGVIYSRMRIVVPLSMRPAMQEIMHRIHLGNVRKERGSRLLAGMNAPDRRKSQGLYHAPWLYPCTAERASDTKRIALLEYRASQFPGIDLSPSQLSMGCRLRTTVRTARGLLGLETQQPDGKGKKKA